MNAAAAGKLALCICTGAVVGAGVNEARHNKPSVTKAAAPKGAGRQVVQFPCEPYIVQDQMLRDAEIPTDFEVSSLPQFASNDVGGGGGGSGGGGNGGEVDGHNGGGGGGQVPEPAMLGLLGLGVVSLLGGRKALLARNI